MASRFYFENTVHQGFGVTVIDSNWTDDIRGGIGIPGRTFVLLPSGSTPTTTAYSGYSGQPAVATPPKYTMHAMFEYHLPVGLLITGNMRGELAGFRSNNGNNVSLALAVHIRDAADVEKATLIQYFPSPSNFFGFTPGHVAAFPSTAITDDGYVTEAGDRLIVELGMGWLAIVANSGITAGYNNGNADWAAGDNGIADTNPTVKNPWIEFETTLAPAPTQDDFLMTLSATSLTARPTTPSKPGLQFFDRTTNIEYLWNGSAWKAMVSSISVNGGTATGGNLLFNNTSTTNVTLTGSTVTWDTQALAPVSNRAKTLLITDDVTEGALLTAANTFAANAIGLLAPNATNALRIGKYGNLAIAGTALVDTTLLNFSKTNYTENATTVFGINFATTNTGTGTGGVIISGLSAAIVGSATGAGGVTTGLVRGQLLTAVGGSGGTNNFQGTVRGLDVSATAQSQTAANPVVLLECIRASGGVILRPAVTDYIGFHASSPSLSIAGSIATIAGITVDAFVLGLAAGTTTTTAYGSRISMPRAPASGSWTITDAYGVSVTGTATAAGTLNLTNAYNFYGAASNVGTNRWGIRLDGMATGTPTAVYGLDVGSHAVGTNRWGVRTANKIENTATDFIASTAGKGFIVLDSADGNFYRIFTTNGFIQTANLGATAPTA